jgi:hypothetical protein
MCAASPSALRPRAYRSCARWQTFWGFDNYDHVQAALDPAVQRRVTTMLPVHEIEERKWQDLLYHVRRARQRWRPLPPIAARFDATALLASAGARRVSMGLSK